MLSNNTATNATGKYIFTFINLNNQLLSNYKIIKKP
jgi:hypothetical protein